jgi:CheY-like chemotaxis protein
MEHVDTHTHAPRILVVDDNSDAAESLAFLIRKLGYDVRTAEDGPTAIQLDAEWHPDLIFLDIGLPGMDGYEVAREIRRARPEGGPQLVALTGYGQDSVRQQSEAAGFTRYILKPAQLKTIVAVLDGLTVH